MKRVILLIAALAVSAAMAFAQGSDKRVSNANAADPTHRAHVDHALHYFLAQGKLMTCGTAEEQKTGVTMKNGIKVTNTGIVTLKDGKNVQMKDGESIDTNGKIMSHEEVHKNDHKAGDHDHSGHDHSGHDHSQEKK
jgi:hypothetical protein